MVPEITVQQLAERIKSPEGFILLDVREPWELARARIDDPRLALAPMSQLSCRGLDALPEEALQKTAEIYVLCHQGVRSEQVTGWLAAQGWTNVSSVAGGIDEYAHSMDPGVGTY